MAMEGWANLLVWASLAALFVGIINSVRMSFMPTTLRQLGIFIVMIASGGGWYLKAWTVMKKRYQRQTIQQTLGGNPLYQQRSPLVSKKPPGGATDEQWDRFMTPNFMVKFSKGWVRPAGKHFQQFYHCDAHLPFVALKSVSNRFILIVDVR
jgi:hypothetical protein